MTKKEWVALETVLKLAQMFIADHCNKGDDEWEYLVAPSTTVDKYCVAVLDEAGEHVGFF